MQAQSRETTVEHVFRDCSACPEMISLPASRFYMGSDAPPSADAGGVTVSEQPVHAVSVATFALGRFEVTREEFARFAEQTHRPLPDRCFADSPPGSNHFGWVKGLSWRNPGYPQTDRDPAVCISWQDALDYTAWLSAKTGHRYRLPSEAEWEYAARAGSDDPPWGHDANGSCAFANVADAAFARVYRDATAVSCDDQFVWTAPVGHYRPNALGFYDLFGNAWEWVQDCRHTDL